MTGSIREPRRRMVSATSTSAPATFITCSTNPTLTGVVVGMSPPRWRRTASQAGRGKLLPPPCDCLLDAASEIPSRVPVEFGRQPRSVGDNERRVGGRLRNRAELNQFRAAGLLPDLRDDVAQCDRLTRRNLDRPCHIALEQPHERIRYIF